MYGMVDAREEIIDLMAVILDKYQIAWRAVDYLARSRVIPEPEEVASALDVPMSTARKIVAAATMSTKFVFGTLSLSLSYPETVAWSLSDLKDKDVENLVVLTVNSENVLIKRHLVATGSAGGVCVNYGDVFRCAIEDHATGVIVAHNHPSGSLEFSKQDYLFSEGLADAGRLLNIRFLDSMVISRQGVVSMLHLAPEIFARPAKERARAKIAGEQDGFPR